MLINVNFIGYDLIFSICWCIMYIKKISGYYLMWFVSIVYIRGYFYNSYMIKIICDVYLVELLLYLINFYYMIIM